MGPNLYGITTRTRVYTRCLCRCTSFITRAGPCGHHHNQDTDLLCPSGFPCPWSRPAPPWQPLICSPSPQSCHFEKVRWMESHSVWPSEIGFLRAALAPSRPIQVARTVITCSFPLLCSILWQNVSVLSSHPPIVMFSFFKSAPCLLVAGLILSLSWLSLLETRSHSLRAQPSFPMAPPAWSRGTPRSTSQNGP